MKRDSSSNLNEVELKVQARVLRNQFSFPVSIPAGIIPMQPDARESSCRTASNLHTPCSQVQFLWEGLRKRRSYQTGP